MTSTTHTYTGYYDPTTGKGHSGQMMKIGQGLEWMVYFTTSFPLINVIKGGYIFSNDAIPGTLDANGYPDASGGGSWKLITHATVNFMNEGTVDEPWVLRWEGTGNVTWNGGTEIPGSTPNRREYTSLAVPDDQYWTTATGDVTKLELLAPGEEARYDAGNILHSRFVADLAGIDVVRLMHSLTDDNGNRDVSDFTPYDYINWGQRLSPNGLVQVKRGIPIQAACEIANELDTNLHYNVPHQITDAAATYIGQQIDLYFDFSGKKVKIELSNEPWNSGPGFKDTWAWFWYGSQSAQEGTFDPVTATCTSVGHNMATGAEIVSFNNIYHKDYPYAQGATMFAIVDDVDTFRCAVTEAAALRGADVYDDTDADYNVNKIPDESVTYLRFKQAITGGIYSPGGYYAERSMQVWDLIGAEIGEENMEVVAGCWANGVAFMEQQLEVPGYRERVMTSGQFYIACYWHSTDIADDFENYTNEQHADYAIDVRMGPGGGWNDYFINHIESLGCYNFSTYECGNHNGNQGAISQEKVDKLISLARDPVEGKRITEAHFRKMAAWGIKVATNFKAHEYYNRDDSRGNTFGSMEHQGDTDAAIWLAIKIFLDLGGVSK